MKFGPQCKICRREGKKLFLKGDRCNAAKCPLLKRKYPPGMHGPKGYGRLSEYGVQLRAKQCLKRSYNILEQQIKNYFKKAKRLKGDTGVNFMKLIELRLDSVIYLAGFVNSRKNARQTVSHGNIFVNNKAVDIPSYQVQVGDIITPRPKKEITDKVSEQLNSRKDQGLKSWFNVDAKNLKVTILKEPEPEDLPKEFDIKLIIEFYNR
ncbi:MAG: 30S ribosomal protein S4 [Patescibacteria group bacterium]|nr:30S ribosomal protein S4 [Patescibacteria group bacterium]MDD5164033.1 30S ribosomal protein S4 [Patescibacteria group bacterium]MDD5534883.1 30S ribosomal protein S4 [Patescibacteria group bacterium]